jgi:hypothetical protein
MWHSFNGSEHGSYSPGMAVFIDHGLLVPVFLQKILDGTACSLFSNPSKNP